MKKKLSIELVVDIVCPWCFVGKKNFLDAVNASKDQYDFDIRILPYQLDPSSPTAGVNRKQYLVNKFGSEARVNEAEGRVKMAAQAAGTDIHMEKMLVHINTFDCHRVIWWAGTKGKQLEVTNAIYDAYYLQGADFSKNKNLAQVVSSVGFNLQEVEAFLESKEGRPEVLAMIEEIAELGISGVPFFIFNREAGVSGAQPKEAFLQAFQELAK
ncbi:MAG: DsbA family oxidoreductase [Bdellovibrio sp.]|nr:DsbA family oxidoreductase [Bdellovibrio sp.]